MTFRLDQSYWYALSLSQPRQAAADSSLPEGAFGDACASLGVWALPDAFVLQMRNWR